jgi:hypothetical protein
MGDQSGSHLGEAVMNCLDVRECGFADDSQAVRNLSQHGATRYLGAVKVQGKMA